MGGPLFAHPVESQEARKTAPRLGGVASVDNDYIYWQGVCVWFSFSHFHGNVLFVCNLPLTATTSVVQMVADMLFVIRDLEVICPCVDGGGPWCDGAGLANTVRALGICMTMGSAVGINSTHPSALQLDWSLRYGKPLITPGRAAREHLSCLFPGSVTAALPSQSSWSAKVLSALV